MLGGQCRDPRRAVAPPCVWIGHGDAAGGVGGGHGDHRGTRRLVERNARGVVVHPRGVVPRGVEGDAGHP